jgi:hypothetical protein
MSKVVKIAVLAGLLATMNGQAYAAPINLDFNNGTFSGWTVVTGAAGFANVVTNAPSRRDLNTKALDETGDPADWRSPLTNTNTPSGPGTFGRFAFLEAGPIPGCNAPGSPPSCTAATPGASPNVYTSIVSNTFVADDNVVSTLQMWAFFDALDQKANPWNDDGYARVFNVTTNSYVGAVYAQSNSTMLCDQGSDASRWPHNSFPYLPAQCVQPFAGPLIYALLPGMSYRVEAGVRNGNPGDNDNTIPAALGLELNLLVPTVQTPVPEPSTLLLFGSGMGIALATYRRRRGPKA